MRDFLRGFTMRVLALVLVAPIPASAVYWEFSGVHSVEFGDYGARVEASASGTGVAILEGTGMHLDTLQLTRPFATLDTVVPVTDPLVTAAGLVEIRVEDVRLDPQGGGGVFGPVTSALQNTALQISPATMPVSGSLRLCLFYSGCNSGALTQTLGGTTNGAPMGTGVGGLLTLDGEDAVRFSMLGAPWTIKTASVSRRTLNGGVTLQTTRGFAHGPASLTCTTIATSGVLQLVTATQISSFGLDGTLGESDTNGRIHRFTLHFTPEPGVMLLLGAGAAGMGLLGRARIR